MHINRQDVSIMNQFVALRDSNRHTGASLRADSTKLPNSAWIAQSVQWLYCRLDDRDSFSDRGKGFFLLPRVHTGSSTFTTSNKTDINRSTTTITAPHPTPAGRPLYLITHHHKETSLRMNGVLPSLPHTSHHEGTGPVPCLSMLGLWWTQAIADYCTSNNKTTHQVSRSLSVVNKLKGILYATVSVMVWRLKREWRYSSTHS